MITAVNLVTIHHLIYIKRKRNGFFLVTRTLRIYSLNNFPLYLTAVLAVVGAS